jgi:hypothetical protein
MRKQGCASKPVDLWFVFVLTLPHISVTSNTQEVTWSLALLGCNIVLRHQDFRTSSESCCHVHQLMYYLSAFTRLAARAHEASVQYTPM